MMDLTYLVSHWASVRAGLVETINKFRDHELDYKPFASSWSAGQIMLHIAHEENGEFSYGIVQTLTEFPPEYRIQDYPTCSSIQSLLASVHAQTDAYLKTLQNADLDRIITTPWGPSYRQVEMIGHLIEHEIHHRAELSLILGMLGRKGLDA